MHASALMVDRPIPNTQPAIWYAVELNDFPLPLRVYEHVDWTPEASDVAKLVFERSVMGARHFRKYVLVQHFEHGESLTDDDAPSAFKLARGVCAVIELTSAELAAWLLVLASRL